MFSKVMGGVEQSFLDYNQALVMQGFDVLPIIHPKAKVRPFIHGKCALINNFSRYDLFAVHKLRKLIEQENPQCIISHSGRSTALFKLVHNTAPIIAVSHNSQFKPFIGVDAIIAVNSQMRAAIIKAGQPEETVYCVPNMIHIPEDLTFVAPKFQSPPAIGMIARFEPKKGIDVFLKALAILKQKGIAFRGVIAGDGDYRRKVDQLIAKLNLRADVELLGWISDKRAFYRQLDIFCLPSNIEPFGIVVLEAFMYSVPSVVTDTEGPSDIATHEKNALIFPKGDSEKLAQSLERLIKDQEFAMNLAKGAYERVQYYSMLNISRLLQRTIEEVRFHHITYR